MIEDYMLTLRRRRKKERKIIFPENPLHGKVIYIGHRAASSEYPENTLLACNKNYYEMGANGIEIDLQLSKDGEVVVVHDATVDRTTSFSGRVNDYTLSELMQMDAGAFKGEEFANRDDTKIPSLELLLDEFKGTEVIFELDIKDSGTIDKAVQMIKEKEMEHNCFFVSGRTNMEYVQENYPEFVSYFGAPYTDIDWRISHSLDKGFKGISWNSITLEETTKAHENGLFIRHSLQYSHVESEALRLLSIGVDFLLTDHPGKMKKTGDRYKIEQFGASDVKELFFNAQSTQTVW